MSDIYESIGFTVYWGYIALMMGMLAHSFMQAASYILLSIVAVFKHDRVRHVHWWRVPGEFFTKWREYLSNGAPDSVTIAARRVARYLQLEDSPQGPTMTTPTPMEAVKVLREALDKIIAVASTQNSLFSRYVGSTGNGALAATSQVEAPTSEPVVLSEHDLGIIRDIDAMAATPNDNWWARALAVGAAQLIKRLRATPQALPATEQAKSVIAKHAKRDDFTQSTAIGYAQFLAWEIWREHYKEASPNFEIMADECGVLSQIDNMVCAWKAPVVSQAKPSREAGHVMMSAHALCPTERAHPDRMRWMAEYFLANYPVSQAKPDLSGLDNHRIAGLLREARATLEMWKDVAPATSLCADIDKTLTPQPVAQARPCPECKGKGGFEESACGEGCCRAGVMCEACQGSGQVVQAKPDLSGLTVWSLSPTLSVMVHDSPRRDGRKKYYLCADVEALLATQPVAQAKQREFCTDGGKPLVAYTPPKLDHDWGDPAPQSPPVTTEKDKS